MQTCKLQRIEFTGLCCKDLDYGHFKAVKKMDSIINRCEKEREKRINKTFL